MLHHLFLNCFQRPIPPPTYVVVELVTSITDNRDTAIIFRPKHKPDVQGALTSSQSGGDIPGYIAPRYGNELLV